MGILEHFENIQDREKGCGRITTALEDLDAAKPHSSTVRPQPLEPVRSHCYSLEAIPEQPALAFNGLPAAILNRPHARPP